MRIIWYKPHEAPDLYQPRYFPVAFSRTEDTIYLPTLDPVQAVEESVDQLFQDDLISAAEFAEVLAALDERREAVDPLRETTPYKLPVRMEQFKQVPGLRPFSLDVEPLSCSVLVRDLRWLRVDDEGDGSDGEQRRLGVWLWVTGYLQADLIDIDVEETYLADAHGEVIARLTEHPRGYRRPDLDAILEDPEIILDCHDANFALTLVFEAPPVRPHGPAPAPDVLRLRLKPLCVRRHQVTWDFGEAEPLYPLIKDAGPSVVLVEGLRSGQLSAEAERRYLDDRNAVSEEEGGPFYAEHPVLLVAARMPQSERPPMVHLDNWRTPVDLLHRCPLSVRLWPEEGPPLAPASITIAVHSNQPNELEASYHFCDLETLPHLSRLTVEVLTVEEA